MLSFVTFVLSAVGSALRLGLWRSAFRDSHSRGLGVKFPCSTCILDSPKNGCRPDFAIHKRSRLRFGWCAHFRIVFSWQVSRWWSIWDRHGTQWMGVSQFLENVVMCDWSSPVYRLHMWMFVQSSTVLRGRAIERVSSWPGVGLPSPPSMWRW